MPYWLKYKWSPPVRKLFTQEEYEEEVRRETEKALSDLRGFCSSPNCDSWKVISRLRDPKRYNILAFLFDNSNAVYTLLGGIKLLHVTLKTKYNG